MSEIIIILSYVTPLIISLIWFINGLIHDYRYDVDIQLLDILIILCICLLPALNVFIAKEAFTDLINKGN